MEVSGKLATSGHTLCGFCKIQRKQKHADGFCSDCNEFMCRDCFRVHLMPVPCRNHVLSSLDQSRSLTPSGVKQEYCKIHKTETVRYYCPVHDTTACGDCVVSNHNKCETLFIRDLARKFVEKSEFQNTISKIKTLKSDVDESNKHCKKYQLEQRSVLDTVLGDIRKFRKELNDFFDQAEKEIINEATKLIKENEKSLAEIEQDIADLMSKISELIKELDPKSYRDVTLFIRFTERKASVNEIQQRLSAIKSRDTSKTITFAPDKTLKEMLKSKPKLGYLKPESQQRFQKEPATDSKYPGRETKVPAVATQTPTKMRQGTSKRLNERTCTSKGKTEAQSATPKYLPPDPRAHGFDVGTRVQWGHWEVRHEELCEYLIPDGNGVVIKVDPDGFVDVKDDSGRTVTGLFAGSEGMFEMVLEVVHIRDDS